MVGKGNMCRLYKLASLVNYKCFRVSKQLSAV